MSEGAHGAGRPGPEVDVVVVAAGRGTRLGEGRPKAFVEIAGRPMVGWALEGVRAIGPGRIVIVVPAEDPARWRRMLEHEAGEPEVEAVAGGATRQASVRAGLAVLRDGGGGREGEEPRLVAIHDGARPCASAELWRRVVDEAGRSGAAIPVLPVADCLKETDDAGRVRRTVPRQRLVRSQTPQAFRFDWLWRAHEEDREGAAPDDAALMEAAGRTVTTVAGDPGNLKVTRPGDLETAASRLGDRRDRPTGDRRSGPVGPSATPFRVGYGFDVHPLVPGRRLVLGGVRIDGDRGLEGHSDGDALTHAVIDALLGAAGLGDIGQHFPADDRRWKDADSLELLEGIGKEIAEAGFRMVNVDATVIAEAPRLGSDLAEMERRLAGALSASPDRVNVKATRMEGLGSLGRGEGIAAHAVATLEGLP